MDKTLSYPVAGIIYTTPGVELAAGDEATIFLNTTRLPALPTSIDAIVQAVTPVNVPDSTGCLVPGRLYLLSYDNEDLEGALTELGLCDVINVAGVACCEALRESLDAEVAARVSADAAIQLELDSWDVLELSAEPSDGVAGVQQIETQTVVGTAGATGNVPVTFTAVGLTGSPLLLNVPVVSGDTDAIIAAKIVAFAEANTAVNAFFEFDQIGAVFTTKWKTAAADDGTGNVAIGAFTGLTPDATSTNTQAGVAASTGDDASRVGQHAQWGNRIWEATSIEPTTWVELNTEFNSISWLPVIRGGPGGLSNRLDSIPVSSEDAEKSVAWADNTDRMFFYKLENGSDAENEPYVIRPDNYAPSTNEYIWVLKPAITTSACIQDSTVGGEGANDAGRVPVFADNGELTVTTFLYVQDDTVATYGIKVSSTATVQTIEFLQNTFTASLSVPVLTANRAWTLPQATGTFSLDRTVSLSSPLTGATTTAATTTKDEFIYVTPAGTIAALTLTLPAAANSRVGQKIEFQSSQIITALTVSVAGGGSTIGTALTTAAANTSYEYVCIVAGTWLRIR